MTSRGAVEVALRVSEDLEAMEVMRSNHATSLIFIYVRAEMLTLLSMIRSECVIPFLICTGPQESD